MNNLLKSLPIYYQHWLFLLMVCLLCSVLHIIDVLRPLLMFTHVSIIDAQYWRLLTHSLVHTNTPHLLLNISGALLLWALHGQFFSYVNYLIIWLLLALGTSIGLYYFSPEMISYVGLSGVLHGFFVIGACEDIKHKEKTGYLLLFAVIAKVIHEQIFGASKEVMQLIDANVAIDAHLYGLISGLFIVIIISSYAYFTKIKA